MGRLERKMTSPQIIILGFGMVILVGSLLLMLPLSTRDGRGANLGEAIFTATSAVCVTGLVVRDTATYWSAFGQGVILLLIQIGGMGVVTVSSAFALLAGRRIGLKERSIMQDAISAPQVGGIVRLTGFIVRLTLLFELAGAALLAPSFCRVFGLGRGLWYSLFHAVSAFCNAGFDLMGVWTPYSSLTAFAGDPVVNLTIMALITIGGIGFLTWDDIKTNGFHLSRYRMQSKVILAAGGVLVALPAGYFFLFEFSGLPLGERVWLSLFQAVTPRTAGFNTADLNGLSEDGKLIMILLMLTGGAPGSTAGGMKTTTVAVLAGTAIAVFRRREHTQFFGRRIGEETVRSAVAILTMYLALALGGAILISRIEGLPLLSCLFETASAVGTVGLTLGLTPGLGGVSRGLLIAMMYLGRVGGLTMIFAAFSGHRGNTARLPQERLTVG